ncbi:MAG TPA: cysteine peptidase family C39 domain-containing protein [Candidatus Nanoarchaeia archaeon]|nr:cysteine peptidase family C39 domain-containing protein [Candidatus Nanoarchaeia archaeon]
MKIPYYRQRYVYTCGPAVMRMALGALGIKRTEDQLARLLNTGTRVGTPNRRFPRVLERFKLSYTVHRRAKFSQLVRHFRNNDIIIVCYFYEPEKVGHFAVVKDISKTRIMLLDPIVGPDMSYRQIDFHRMWKKTGTFDNEKGWFIAIHKK